MTELPGWKLDHVDPARMKTLALLLADPNPIHLDAAAARRLGVADRQVNQGPSTMAMAANMLLAAFPGPTNGPLDGGPDFSRGGGVRRAIIEHHRDVRTEHALDFHHLFWAEKKQIAIEV